MEMIFCKVLSLDLAAAIAVGLVLIARFCFRKAPKRCSYLLWSVVLIRLLIPFSIQLPGKSLLPVNADTFSPGLALEATPTVDSGNRIVDSAINSVLPTAEIGASVNPLQILLTVGTVVWIAGILIFAVISAYRLLRLDSLLAGAKRERDVIVCENLDAAFVRGIFRPVICLPAGLSEREQSMMIAHERGHIKRGDHIVKLIAYILLVIHWYDPVIWLAFDLMTRDMEMSCDERVINGGCDRADYAKALLKLSTGKEIMPTISPTFGEGVVKERIVNVMKTNTSNTFVSFVAVIAAALILTACTLTGSSGKTRITIPQTNDHPEVSVRMTLPDGWKVGEKAESSLESLTGELIAINDKAGNLVATIGAKSYPDYSNDDTEQYPAPFSENYWSAVFFELRLPAHYNWDIDPESRIKTDDGETMKATVYSQIPEDGVSAAEWESVENPGIVSYNESMHTYVFIEFHSANQGTIDGIAKDLEFASMK